MWRGSLPLLTSAFGHQPPCRLCSGIFFLFMPISCHAKRTAMARAANAHSLLHFHSFPSLRVLLVNTKVPRSTRALVAGVRVLKDKVRARRSLSGIPPSSVTGPLSR
jgi:hypothetical protein